MLSLLGGGVAFIALIGPLGFIIPGTLCGMGVARSFDAPFGLRSLGTQLVAAAVLSAFVLACKPLIVMAPKSLLRHKRAVSNLEDLTPGTTFHRVMIDGAEAGCDVGGVTLKSDDKIRRVIMCSGKVYFDLLKARRAAGQTDVALARLEQLYPFPIEEYEALLARYPKAREVVWCQEEPQNQGAWYQIRHQLERPIAGKRELLYSGRAPAAAPATGIAKVHEAEQAAIVRAALSATVREVGQRETARLSNA
jgi:2-oxoglutarate dehydrogenase E1 component